MEWWSPLPGLWRDSPIPGGQHPTGALNEDPRKEGVRMLLGVMLRFDLCVNDENRSRVNEKEQQTFFSPQ